MYEGDSRVAGSEPDNPDRPQLRAVLCSSHESGVTLITQASDYSNSCCQCCKWTSRISSIAVSWCSFPHCTVHYDDKGVHLFNREIRAEKRTNGLRNAASLRFATPVSPAPCQAGRVWVMERCARAAPSLRRISAAFPWKTHRRASTGNSSSPRRPARSTPRLQPVPMAFMRSFFGGEASRRSALPCSPWTRNTGSRPG